jgi:acyl carrier protein
VDRLTDSDGIIAEKSDAPRRAPATQTSSDSACDEIAAALRAMFGELSGLDAGRLDGDTRFTELGFESLFLTQASLAIEKRFGVKIAFRQLLAEFPTLNTVAGHIAKTIERQLVEEIDKLSDDEAQRLMRDAN